MSKNYAYLRVSTLEQNTENQQIDIQNYCNKNKLNLDQIYQEAVSGKIPIHKRKIGILLNKVQPGDTIIFTEMSRFGRNSGELINILQDLIHKNINFIFIKEGLDTKNQNTKILTNLMISIFSGIAQFERDLIRERTIEGLKRAKQNGQILGRPLGSLNKNMKLDNKIPEIRKYLNMGLNKTSISKLVGVTPKTLSKYCKIKKL